MVCYTTVGNGVKIGNRVPIVPRVIDEIFHKWVDTCESEILSAEPESLVITFDDVLALFVMVVLIIIGDLVFSCRPACLDLKVGSWSAKLKELVGKFF